MQQVRKILVPLVIAAAMLLAVQLAFRAAVDLVAKPAAASGERSALVIGNMEQVVLVAPTDTSLQARFPVSNAGQRRLVLRQVRRPCCDPPGPAPLILAPGESGELIVEAPAAALLKSGQFRQGFGTNDPLRPEFWLTVRMGNEPTPTERPSALPDTRSAEHSVLVREPATASSPASAPAGQ